MWITFNDEFYTILQTQKTCLASEFMQKKKKKKKKN